MRRAVIVLLQSVLLSGGAAALGLAVNALRPGGLPLVAEEPYAIYKDCPLLTKEAQAVTPEALEADLGGLVVVDARPAKEAAAGRPVGALPVPFDLLDPVDPGVVAELRARGPGRVLVVGDTEIDSGRLLAGELAEAGLQGVRYLKGGFPAWRQAGRPVEGAPQPGPDKEVVP
ncbi:MAG TPA: rhodanese-like domain-containing protein [Myxococcota bacterium]|nr:rhodanese-like domain-containing protein [Myxococcota bacterium]HRY95753.1 rhodanese-like domain-containing protein [Myxococcota bacterium]